MTDYRIVRSKSNGRSKTFFTGFKNGDTCWKWSRDDISDYFVVYSQHPTMLEIDRIREASPMVSNEVLTVQARKKGSKMWKTVKLDAESMTSIVDDMADLT